MGRESTTAGTPKPLADGSDTQCPNPLGKDVPPASIQQHIIKQTQPASEETSDVYEELTATMSAPNLSLPKQSSAHVEQEAVFTPSPFRWVRHNLTAIPERGESTASYLSFQDVIVPPS